MTSETRTAEDSTKVFIDREHDGPWMSVMSLDGQTMYVNSTLPELVRIENTDVDVGAVLKHHECPEWDDLEKLISDFKLKHEAEPDTPEREELYLKAHRRSGTPSERAYCQSNGINWRKWSAWCRGEESRIEKGPFKNEPEDADVKPIPHTHGELAATDSALRIAFDRESVRQMDTDGRMRVASANISKATVNPYRGSEIPDWEELGLDSDKVYYLLRDPEELRKAAPTFNGVQLLRKHTPVSADDHRPDQVVGSVGSDCSFDDPYLKSSLSIWAKDAIDEIESGAKKELSSGYHYRPDMTPGNFDGKQYDGVMRDIVGNHVALVEDGRAGPDVVIGDSTEGLMMPNEAQTMAIATRALTIGALARYLKPKLAQDARIDMAKVFDGITGKNFKNQKSSIAARLRNGAKGKLAKDATLDDVEHVLEMLDKHELDGGGDESVSKEQHNAMEAAAHGASNLGIPQGVGKEFAEADKGKTFDQHMKEWLGSKGMGDDAMAELTGMDWFPKAATDENATPEGEKEKLKEEETQGGESKESKAMEARDKHMAGDSVTKQAMDSAIKLATEAAEKRVRSSVLKSQQEVREAMEEIRPFVGQLPASMGFDSAEQVKRHALVILNVPGAKTMHPDALSAVLAVQPKPGSERRDSYSSNMATDSASIDDLEKMYPGIGRIVVM
jgi:uncharacterized protein